MNELDFTPEGRKGKLGYEAYAKSTGGKTFDGRDMPSWNELGPKIQGAWVAAGEAVAFATLNDKER